MNKRDILLRLAYGVNADLNDYAVLKKRLEAQFTAALHHRSAELATLGEAITGLAEVIEARRRERVELVAALLDGRPGGSVNDVLALFPEATRRMCLGWWQELESLVRDCKAQNARVCQLVTEQHQIMTRVLDGESDVYAPL